MGCTVVSENSANCKDSNAVGIFRRDRGVSRTEIAALAKLKCDKSEAEIDHFRFRYRRIRIDPASKNTDSDWRTRKETVHIDRYGDGQMDAGEGREKEPFLDHETVCIANEKSLFDFHCRGFIVFRHMEFDCQ